MIRPQLVTYSIVQLNFANASPMAYPRSSRAASIRPNTCRKYAVGNTHHAATLHTASAYPNLASFRTPAIALYVAEPARQRDRCEITYPNAATPATSAPFLTAGGAGARLAMKHPHTIMKTSAWTSRADGGGMYTPSAPLCLSNNLTAALT